MKTQSQATPMAESLAAIEQMQSLFDIAHTNTQAAIAIIDAARVLTALERTPAHTEHNVLTGEGFARGNTARDETVPAILFHAMSLLEIAINDVDVMRENAIDALKGSAA